ncbi:MAG: alanine racemase [Selenomonadaceae bacterium]
MSNRGAWVEVSLSAIRKNIEAIKSKIADGAKFCAVVKADAYGHGAIAVAREAVNAGADYLAVATLDEAIKLREAGFLLPILILGPTQSVEADDVVHYDVTQAVCTRELCYSLAVAARRQGKKAHVHLAVDTGMCRIGVRPEEAGAMAEYISGLDGVELTGMFSHFALADARDKFVANKAFERFKKAMKDTMAHGVKVPICHIANSAAILDMPETHLSMARAGVILYGLWPSDEVKREIELVPAMSVKARISYVKTIHRDESVSYGAEFTAPYDMRVATIPIGYADGYTRLFNGKAEVSVKGQRKKVLGRICMDQCMVDVSDIDDVKVGDVVTVMGEGGPSADELASWMGTINYEIVCMFANRLPRIYVE